MASELASVFVTVRARMDQLNKDFSKGRSVIVRRMREMQSTVTSRMKLIIGGGLAIAFAAAIRSSTQQAAAEAVLEAQLKATGNAAGFTAGQLKKMASELQNVTTVGDEVQLAAMSILLSFKSIQGTNFSRAVGKINDVAVAMGTDLKSATLQLAKALEDPERNMGALNRAGVSFTQTEIDLIQTLAATNRMFEAQALILEKIEGQVGETALELSKTLGGQLTQLKNLIGDVFEDIGDQIAKVLSPITAVGKFIANAFIAINEATAGVPAMILGVTGAIVGLAVILPTAVIWMGALAISTVNAAKNLIKTARSLLATTTATSANTASNIINAQSTAVSSRALIGHSATSLTAAGSTTAFSVATNTATASLVGLRAGLTATKLALIATGVGALVVLAGVLVGVLVALTHGFSAAWDEASAGGKETGFTKLREAVTRTMEIIGNLVDVIKTALTPAFMVVAEVGAFAFRRLNGFLEETLNRVIFFASAWTVLWEDMATATEISVNDMKIAMAEFLSFMTASVSELIVSPGDFELDQEGFLARVEKERRRLEGEVFGGKGGADGAPGATTKKGGEFIAIDQFARRIQESILKQDENELAKKQAKDVERTADNTQGMADSLAAIAGRPRGMQTQQSVFA